MNAQLPLNESVISETPRTAARISEIGKSGVDWHYSATLVARLSRDLERELAESERDHEQLMNYLTAKLGTKGEHSVFETIDNVAAKLSAFSRARVTGPVPDNPKEDGDAQHQAWLKSPQGREYLEKLKQQVSWEKNP